MPRPPLRSRAQRLQAQEREQVSSPPSHSSDPTELDENGEPLPDPPELAFFETTYHTYRASPLYVGSRPLTEARLDALAHELRGVLVGDNIRGLELRLPGDGEGVGEGGGAGHRYGSLALVSFEWARSVVDGDNSGNRFLLLTLEYETAQCQAILLSPAGIESGGQQTGFMHLPLLLMRMPPTVRAAVVGFLAQTFDCRISPLGLRGGDLVDLWEGWMRDTGLRSGPQLKDTVITLGFRLLKSPPPASATVGATGIAATEPTALGLRTLEVIVPAADLRRFVKEGRVLARNDEEQQRQAEHEKRPFHAALSRYVKHHLAIDMGHEAVQIVRIACGGFVISEGRVKLFEPNGGGDEELWNRQAKAADKLLQGMCTGHVT